MLINQILIFLYIINNNGILNFYLFKDLVKHKITIIQNLFVFTLLVITSFVNANASTKNVKTVQQTSQKQTQTKPREQMPIKPKTPSEKGFFNFYVGGYLGGSKGAASFAEKYIKEDGKNSNLNFNYKISPTFGLNTGLQLDLRLVRFYFDIFGDLAFNSKSALTLTETVKIGDFEAPVNAMLDYKKKNLIGAKINMAINLYLFDLYFGGGVVQQRGEVYLKTSTDGGICEAVQNGLAIKVCLDDRRNLTTNMFMANVGIQKEFRKFALYLDLTGYIPTDYKIDDITVENLLLDNENTVNKVHGFNGSNLMIKLGMRYYF